MANGNFGGGDGTQYNPFLVEDAEDLNAVRDSLSAHYKQTADIDLNIYSTGAGWIPIGQETVKFTGVYDGDNYEIRNLWCNNTEGQTGLFGRINGAKLRNIKLKNIIIVRSGASGVGGLVGIANDLTENAIYNCHAEGIINESQQNLKSVGGLIGGCTSITTQNAISKCSFSGVVFSTTLLAGYIGGLIGSCAANVSECFSKGWIKATSCSSVGGLIGILSDATCSYCYSLTDINQGENVTTNSQAIGGLIGGGRGSVINSWSHGKVKGYSGVGGFIGSGVSANFCYSTGLVEGEGAGISGFSNADAAGCVWDIETSGQTTSASGIGKTTEEMKNKQTYLDLGWSI